MEPASGGRVCRGARRPCRGLGGGGGAGSGRGGDGHHLPDAGALGEWLSPGAHINAVGAPAPTGGSWTTRCSAAPGST